MKTFNYICFCILFLSTLSQPANALQHLTASQMKDATAQAGISIGLDNIKIESWTTGCTVANPDDGLQYISFEQGH